MSPKKPKKVSIFKKLELFLTKYKNIISLLFGLFGIIFGFYKSQQTSSYKNKVEIVTTTLDSTIDANGVLTVKHIETVLRMKDLEKLSSQNDATIRQLLDEINKGYKTKVKIVSDTLMVSYVKHDTIFKTIHDTIKIISNKNIIDTIKDTTPPKFN